MMEPAASRWSPIEGGEYPDQTPGQALERSSLEFISTFHSYSLDRAQQDEHRQRDGASTLSSVGEQGEQLIEGEPAVDADAVEMNSFEQCHQTYLQR